MSILLEVTLLELSSIASFFSNNATRFFLQCCKHYEERIRDVPADCHNQNLLSPKSAIESYMAHCTVFFQVTVCYDSMCIELIQGFASTFER
jgi:hypothetical protein